MQSVDSSIRLVLLSNGASLVRLPEVPDVRRYETDVIAKSMNTGQPEKQGIEAQVACMFHYGNTM